MSDEPVVPRDKLGRVICVGDTVVFGGHVHRHGLGKSKVVKITEKSVILEDRTVRLGKWTGRLGANIRRAFGEVVVVESVANIRFS
jgi:hypothetical protein